MGRMYYNRNHPRSSRYNCSSCWAFSASEVLSDRLCIYSKGKINVLLSAQDLVSCDDHDNQCQGGTVYTSMDYLNQSGIVPSWCFPYVSGKEGGNVPVCPKTCSGGRTQDIPFLSQKYFSLGYYQVGSSPATREREIMEEIYERGSVNAGFQFYTDMLNYTGGVYKRSPSAVHEGGHFVKIIGWGETSSSSSTQQQEEEEVEKYWIIVNEFGKSWGLGGYLLMARGINECELEQWVWGLTPNLKDVPKT